MAKSPKDKKPADDGEHFTLESLPASKIRNAPRGADPAQRVRMILRVRAAGYVPRNVKIRTHVDPHLFTAESDVGELQTLQDDPQVESVEIAEVLSPTGNEKK